MKKSRTICFTILLSLLAISCASLRGSNRAGGPPLADSSFIVPKPGVLKPGTGGLVGRVVDVQTGEGLPGANVLILGTKIGATTDLDGSYLFHDIPLGVCTLQVGMPGYSTTKRALKIKPDTVRQQTIRLKERKIYLDLSKDPEYQARLAEEEKEIRERLRLDPSDTSARYKLAGICEARRNYKAAIKELRILVKLRPDDGDLHYRLRDVLDKDYQLDESEKEYRIALRTWPEDGEEVVRFAGWLQERKKYEEAIVEYRRAIQLGVDGAWIRSFLGDLLSHFGRWAEAGNEYRMMDQMQNPNPNEEGHIRYLTTRAKELGRRLYQDRESYRLNPKDSGARHQYFSDLFNYGYDLVCFKTPEKYKDAANAFEEAISINPKDTEELFYLACCYAALGEKEKAVKSLQDSIKKGFNDWSKWILNKELGSIRTDQRVKEMEKTVKERWRKVLPRPIIHYTL